MDRIKDHNRRKIFIYYFLSIVLPCIILCLLAFRGIRNDQALVEREQAQFASELFDTVRSRVLVHLDSIEKSFEPKLKIPPEQSLLFYDSVLKKQFTNYPQLLSLFYFDKNRYSFLAGDRILHFPRQFLHNSKNSNDEIQSGFDYIEGWRLEFQERNYAKALEFYQNILEGTPQQLGQILNSMARIEKKQENYEQAISIYERIMEISPEQYLQGKIPLSVVASREAATLHLIRGDTTKSLKLIADLLNHMLEGKWIFSSPFYSNTMTDLKFVIDKLSNSLQSKAHIKLLNRNLRYLDQLEIKDAQALQIIQFIESFDRFKAMTFDRHRFRYQIGDVSLYIALLKIGSVGNWGLIYDLKGIIKDPLTRIMYTYASGAGFEWTINSTKDTAVARSSNYLPESKSISFQLDPEIPEITVRFYPRQKGFLALFMHSAQGLFFYIFIVVLVILSLGLFFILRMVNQEVKLSQMKSYFISTVSHEFKSPLTGIRQVSEMLDQGRIQSEERKKYYYKAMVKQSERLTHLIDNILNFSKMEEGKKIFNFQKIDMVQLVHEMVNSFLQMIPDKNVDIRLNLDNNMPPISCDRMAMEQVVFNLLDNAYKYSGTNKTIEISVHKQDEKMILRIKDQGIGIEKEDQQKIFDRFFRAGDQLNHKIKGSGIGLTIVKQIIDAHHGEIRLQSVPGKGSTFHISLPA